MAPVAAALRSWIEHVAHRYMNFDQIKEFSDVADTVTV